MADANSMGLVPVARSRRGAKLFDNPCPACGKARVSERPMLGKLCIGCTAKAASKVAASVAKQGPYISCHPLYPLWNSLVSRCEYVNHTSYRHYGGRGIYVCAEWRESAGAFIAWALRNGHASDLDLDRIDGDGPYAPWNCQFISHVANVRKSRSTQCTEERARSIKQALATGRSITNVARDHGFAFSLVYAIKHGETWRDV